MRGSIDISTPARATGRLSVDNTSIDANVAPPPTPATPNELKDNYCRVIKKII